MQPVECTVEIIGVHAVRSGETAPVSEPAGVNASHLGGIGVVGIVRYIAAIEDAILVAHQEAPHLLRIARRLILQMHHARCRVHVGVRKAIEESRAQRLANKPDSSGL